MRARSGGRTWPNAARDRGTYCMSCHTTLPYAIARPALRVALGEREPSAAEAKILGNLLTRARNWRDVEPWYPDQTRGIPKTSESRAIESVMNALVIARRDAPTGQLSDDGRTALGVMWKLQMKTGPEFRRVDLAELQLRAVGIAQLAVLRRLARGAGRRLGARRLCRRAGDSGEPQSPARLLQSRTRQGRAAQSADGPVGVRPDRRTC